MPQIKCCNHEAYTLGSDAFVQHEDEDFLEVGDEAVIGGTAFPVTAKELQEWGGWGFIIDMDSGRKLPVQERNVVFGRCPHHGRR